MEIKFDVRELRQLWVRVRLAFLLSLGILVVGGVGLWLLFQKSLVGAFLFFLLMAAAAFVVRYGLKVKDQGQEPKRPIGRPGFEPYEDGARLVESGKTLDEAWLLHCEKYKIRETEKLKRAFKQGVKRAIQRHEITK